MLAINFKQRYIKQHPASTKYLDIVAKFKNSVSRDYYFMYNSFVKVIIGYIVIPLTICFNACLREGVFPDKLKISRTIPIHKKGSWDQAENFRPISILPIILKVLEAVIQRQLYDYFVVNKIFVDTQYGYQKGRSSIDAVER